MFQINQHNQSKYVCLFASCLLTKGENRALLSDTQRGTFELIPNDMVNFLEHTQHHSIGNIFTMYGESNKDILESYIDFLLRDEYIFLTDEETREHFTPLKKQWKSPHIISNAIIDISSYSDTATYYDTVIKQLDTLRCQALQIRSYTVLTIDQITHLVTSITDTCIESIELYTPYAEPLTPQTLNNLFYEHTKMATIILHSAPYTNDIEIVKGLSTIHFTEETLASEQCCGIVSKKYFNPSKDMFMESQFHNTCLNRKISVDKDGFIKNCPSMRSHYGHCSQHTLQEVVLTEKFKALGNITKDQISICKTCEFRHVCTDCRAYTEDPSDMYSKPLKCGYNPITNEWEEWSTNPLKQKAITHYGLHQLVKS
ncbi:grasp-with-spasm system SPASM domain peptide maturase [Dokdonia ponticola]|uniref:Grasp-with-spasm system SPASM domain peptide maturase n=1 Tax=Dokdonia ponticola TaxID=2041041 RepID=A0ABV9HRQ7_9FLAO